jgi:hypothetical protein
MARARNKNATGEVVEALIEDRNELKPQDGLHAGKHHARLVGGMRGFIFERFALLVFHALTAVAAIPLAGLGHGPSLAPPVGRQGPAYIVAFLDTALGVAAHIALAAAGRDQLAFGGRPSWCFLRRRILFRGHPVLPCKDSNVMFLRQFHVSGGYVVKGR